MQQTVINLGPVKSTGPVDVHVNPDCEPVGTLNKVVTVVLVDVTLVTLESHVHTPVNCSLKQSHDCIHKIVCVRCSIHCRVCQLSNVIVVIISKCDCGY